MEQQEKKFIKRLKVKYGFLISSLSSDLTGGNMTKRKIIVFGAGNGGFQVSYLLDQQFEIVAFVDNNPSKQGGYLLSKPIIGPQEINRYSFELVIIAVLDGKSIYQQLINELEIPKEIIIDYFNDQMLDVRVGALRLVANEIYENQVQGSVAELGVYKGEFARYINTHFSDRKLYLFDTFEGFSANDIEREKEFGFSDAIIGEFKNEDIDMVLSKMPHRENCIIRKGYFPETTTGVDDSFAFVSLDVDLYDPILEGLKFFYPRLTKGGYIFVHDYNSTRFLGVKTAVKEYCKQMDITYVPLNDICGSIVIMK